MNAESEGEKMYLDKWRVAIRNLKNSLFSYPNTAQSCFPDPITDDTVFYCVQGLVYGSQKFPDGKFIRSSPVTSVYSEDGKLFAKTINNVYELKTPSDYFVIDSVGLAESEEKLDLWDTLGRYYIDSELMEFYDCDTKNLIFCNLTNSPIYVTIYESSAAMLCMPNTAKIASRKVKEK